MTCNPGQQGPPLSEVLRRIELHRVYDVHEVAAALDAVAARWTLDPANPAAAAGHADRTRTAQPAAPGVADSRPGLVIVDSVSAAIAPVYGRPLHGNEGVKCVGDTLCRPGAGGVRKDSTGGYAVEVPFALLDYIGQRSACNTQTIAARHRE